VKPDVVTRHRAFCVRGHRAGGPDRPDRCVRQSTHSDVSKGRAV